jgi:hypothetical protein
MHVLLLLMLLQANPPHSVTFPITDTEAGVSFNLYRAATCAGPFVKVASAPVGATTIADSGMTWGTYCYQATAVGGGIEGAPSAQVQVKVAPFPPQI